RVATLLRSWTRRRATPVVVPATGRRTVGPSLNLEALEDRLPPGDPLGLIAPLVPGGAVSLLPPAAPPAAPAGGVAPPPAPPGPPPAGGVSATPPAPGENIYSTLPNGQYGYKSGTSMATPHVAGTAALVLAQNPSWSATQVISRIESTVTPDPTLAG